MSIFRNILSSTPSEPQTGGGTSVAEIQAIVDSLRNAADSAARAHAVRRLRDAAPHNPKVLLLMMIMIVLWCGTMQCNALTYM